MSSWLSTIISAISALVAAGIVVGVIQGTLKSLVEGQNHMQETLDELKENVGDLTIKSAVNASEHEDILRRIGELEHISIQMSEKIRVLSVRSHLHANKLMQMDPAFKPYRQDDSE